MLVLIWPIWSSIDYLRTVRIMWIWVTPHSPSLFSIPKWLLLTGVSRWHFGLSVGEILCLKLLRQFSSHLNEIVVTPCMYLSFVCSYVRCFIKNNNNEKHKNILKLATHDPYEMCMTSFVLGLVKGLHNCVSFSKSLLYITYIFNFLWQSGCRGILKLL